MQAAWQRNGPAGSAPPRDRRCSETRRRPCSPALPPQPTATRLPLHVMGARALAPLLLAPLLLLLLSAAPAAHSLQLLQPYRRAAVFVNTSVADALANSAQHAAAVLVVSGGPGAHPPARRQPGQPLLSFSPAVEEALPDGVRRVLLSGMQQVEALRPGRLLVLQLDALGAQPPAAAGRAGATAASPWAVLDVSAGRLLLHPLLLQQLRSTPVEATAVLADACLRSIAHLVQQAQQAFPASLQHLSGQVAAAAAAGVAAAFAAAAVPKWFCLACPIVLGLLAPLIINAGVGEAANAACKAMQLPDDDCVSLWFAALALGMILSLLSAIPIFKFCKLAECAHPGNTTRTVAAAL